ncbi:hypothetical protein HUN41_00282 [Streptomyces phage Coruscant]|uniref:Uncharacterized protein n=1 Tax=Streptomyces phage Coruscant TaxID=2739834 RepID=A0A7G4AVV6_9CAUD|nr:hypothetical protein PP454_gp016 [Streptomyces phage Coruscant]YP_010651605.1 hypothetical protein PP454_gp047 [Streptomyces phage Coruscant]QMP84146.1 hypothetical protein HUN41_00016 [Streptomyces phage Coruscant]QMP84370.1 hypothetical protein HUN41_00282 [Streptomyces phage Coruscant]
MTVTLAKASDSIVAEKIKKLDESKFVNSVELTDTFKMKGQKGKFSIRLETWRVAGSTNGQTEVRIVIRDENGQWHGATNFAQDIMFEITNLMNGNHSNRRKK